MAAYTIARLVAAEKVRRLPWGGVQDAAIRTTHSYTLGERLDELNSTVALWKQRMKGDPDADPPVKPMAPPLSLFEGTSNDLAKNCGWKAVATELMEQGSIAVAEAVERCTQKRSGLLAYVTRHFYPGGGLLVDELRGRAT